MYWHGILGYCYGSGFFGGYVAITYGEWGMLWDWGLRCVWMMGDGIGLDGFGGFGMWGEWVWWSGKRRIGNSVSVVL